jgi:hypothetical protein
MTTRNGDVVIIEAEPLNICESCGFIAETRPYGVEGAKICFSCAMKDEENTKRMFREKVLNER